MPKTPAGTPKIKVSNGRLQIVLTHRGVRKYLSLGLPESKRNRTYADMVRSQIENDLLSNIFDSTLEKYRRDATKKVVDAPVISELTIEKLWGLYAAFKKPQVAPSTFGRDYARISRYIPQFPVTSPDDAVIVRNWLNSETSADVARRVLTQLSACFKWGVKSRLITDNPFADSLFVKNPERVETMMMLMGLSLLVYTIGQREIRINLRDRKSSVKNQLNKLTTRPTLRWIFQCFQGIHCFKLEGIERISNLSEERCRILDFLPIACQRYYLIT